MAVITCAVCTNPLPIKNNGTPSGTVCDDCIIEKLWNVKLDGDVDGGVAIFMPQPPSKPAGRKRAA